MLSVHICVSVRWHLFLYLGLMKLKRNKQNACAHLSPTYKLANISIQRKFQCRNATHIFEIGKSNAAIFQL